MKRRLALGAVAASIVFAAACGGKVIFEASTGSGGTGGSTSTLNTTSQVVGATGTNGVATGATTGKGVSATSGSVMSSGSNAVSAVSTGSGPPPPPPSPIFCNGQPCGGNQICCFNPNGPGDHCGNAGQCGPGYVELQCTGPGDCPGAFCCATITGMSMYQGMQCQPTCNGPNEFIMCSLDPLACPAGTTCHKSMQLGNPYRLCY